MEPLNFRPKLAVFDLDGTLTESKQDLEPAMGVLLQKLMEQMPVAIMSGGSFAQFQKQFLPGLSADARLDKLYLFPTSAAACYAFENDSWKTVYDHQFSAAEKEKIISSIHDGMESTHFEVPQELFGEQIEDRGSEITFSALGQQAPIELKEHWDPAHEKRKPLYDFLVAALPEYRVALNATTSIDITKKGIDKAFGVRELSRIAAVAIEDMLYVGDALFPGGNDEVVIKTGIRTHSVVGPGETKELIEMLIR